MLAATAQTSLALTNHPSQRRHPTLHHPPIPKESLDTEKVVIVHLAEHKTRQEVERLLKHYPGIQLRHVFEYAFKGFSVKGKLQALEKLKKDHEILTVSNVSTYQITSDANFDLIGGEEVRGFLDKKGNRLAGKGIKVGVIDTGIDYTHPDLRKNYKGGQDLVDQDKDPMETRGMFGQNTLHGTHVAGIIGANGRMRGMAPEAEIIAYRALGPGGSGTTEQVLAAIDRAIKDKVDVLNLSLGNSINGPDLPISLALNKAVDSGIVAVTSSGNSGPNIWTVGSPGTASKAISVGASTPPMKIPYIDVQGEKVPFRIEPLQGSKNWELRRVYELQFAGLGKKKNLPDLKGKIALIERGEITFTEKAKNAAKAGAIAVIIYNNTKGNFMGNLEERVSIPVASISKELGLKLKKRLETDELITRIQLIEEKDVIADFSSRGPVTDTWEIKPDVVAPGVAINSTIPGGYLPLQGTSMAAPHVAGACALIKQAHPDWTPAQVKAALMNTALPLTKKDGSEYLTYEQGAGRIQTKAAIETETLALPGSLQFGKFQLSDKMHEHQAVVEVQNVGTEEKQYYFSVPKNEPGIEWEIPLSFSIKPGEKKKVRIGMVVDPKTFKNKIHDGVLILNEGNNKIRIPYIYVLEEPNYPRVMGFDFAKGDKQDTYRYEVYLPGGAEEFGIALFDPDSYQFKGFLDWARDVKKGLIEKELKTETMPKSGYYLAKVFAKKAGQEDMIEVLLYIQGSETNPHFRKRIQ